MARRGENIYKWKDNRWEGRYIKGYDYKGKVLFGYVYAKTYREVREKLTAAKQTSFNKPTPAERISVISATSGSFSPAPVWKNPPTWNIITQSIGI